MRARLLEFIGVAVVLLVVVGLLNLTRVGVAGQTATGAQADSSLRTPWGEPDLQGIWSVELLVPLERPDGVTTEFYTEEQVAELDRRRANTSVFGNHVRGAGERSRRRRRLQRGVHVAEADRPAHRDGH